MRVIAGQYRSRKIKEVKSNKTRPTTDKNKESLFNSLGQYFDGETVLDIFAGSGALGIEALSRGAKTAYFIDNFQIAINTIKDNIKSLGIESDSVVIKQDVFSFLNNTEKHFDLIIADPPYALQKYHELLELIVSRQLLSNDGIIVFEADKQTVLPEEYNNVYKYKEKILGHTKIGFYRKEE